MTGIKTNFENKKKSSIERELNFGPAFIKFIQKHTSLAKFIIGHISTFNTFISYLRFYIFHIDDHLLP